MADNNRTRTNGKPKTPRPIRSLPGWQITERMKRNGIRQYDIAATAKVTQSQVSEAINRRSRKGRAVELIWDAIEKALAHGR